jgi:hypothetical protein
VDAVVTATRSAQRTHQRGKLNALRYAVLNSTLPGAPDTDEQMVFFRWVDDFTVGHLQLLTYLNHPRDWYAKHNIEVVEYGMAGSRRQAMEIALPAFAERKDFTDVLLADLSNAGLTLASLGGNVTGSAVYDALTTPLAKRFIAFITEPRSVR